MAKKILVVEDEQDIIELVSYNLEMEGYEVVAVKSGDLAVPAVNNEKPDLILLDIMLPKMNGFEICTQIKKNPDFKKIPIIMLTAKAEDSDIVQGLELGADDYIIKPFSPRVLRARVKALLRREAKPAQSESSFLTYGDLKFDMAGRQVYYKEEAVHLTFSEFQSLALLLSKPGVVFSRFQLISEVHGDEHVVTDRTVDVMIVSLRKKIPMLSTYLETVRGVGYRLKPRT